MGTAFMGFRFHIIVWLSVHTFLGGNATSKKAFHHPWQSKVPFVVLLFDGCTSCNCRTIIIPAGWNGGSQRGCLYSAWIWS